MVRNFCLVFVSAPLQLSQFLGKLVKYLRVFNPNDENTILRFSQKYLIVSHLHFYICFLVTKSTKCMNKNPIFLQHNCLNAESSIYFIYGT